MRGKRGRGGGFVADDRAWDLWLSEGNEWHKIGIAIAQLRSDELERPHAWQRLGALCVTCWVMCGGGGVGWSSGCCKWQVGTGKQGVKVNVG